MFTPRPRFFPSIAITLYFHSFQNYQENLLKVKELFYAYQRRPRFELWALGRNILGTWIKLMLRKSYPIDYWQ